MQFKLTIEMGNDAMRTNADVASALREVADRLKKQCSGRIADVNGNTVGKFEIAEPDDVPDSF